MAGEEGKKPFFEKHLDRAGYEYEFFNGPFAGVVTFKVTTDDPESLHDIVRNCQADAARNKKRP